MKYTLMTTSMVFPMAGKLSGGASPEDIRKEYSDMMAMISECGLNAVEITSLELDMFGPDYVKKVLEQNGLSCGCVIHMDKYAETDPSKHESIVQSAQEKILEAKYLGAEYVMLALMAQENAEEHSSAELTSALITNIRPIAEFGKEQSITVSIEDTPDIRLPLSGSNEIRPLLDAIPELSLTYDTGNMIFRNEDPVHFYDALRDRVAYVHIKDMEYTESSEGADITEDGRYVRTALHGHGVIDFKSIITALHSGGYDGWLMLEYAGHADHRDNIIAAKEYIDSCFNISRR